MSVDHWWIGFLADESEYERLTPHFAVAAENAVLSPQSQQALDAWRQRSSDFEQDLAMNDEAADRANAFIWAFNIPSFVALAKELLMEGGKLADFAAEKERSFRMAIAPRHAPVSILWHALGYERASLLPGKMGNMLLHPGEIEQAQEKTCSAFAGTLPRDLIDAARRFCSWSVDDDTLHEIMSFLPDGLARARELQRGLLALGLPRL